MMLIVGFSHIDFIPLRYAPYNPTYSETFITRMCSILSKAFSVSIEKLMWFLFLSPFMWFVIIIDLHMLNFRYKVNLVMVDKLFNVCLYSVCKYCIEHFGIHVYVVYCLGFDVLLCLYLVVVQWLIFSYTLMHNLWQFQSDLTQSCHLLNQRLMPTSHWL